MAGLAFGIPILSEVFYYYSYDGFYPDASRIYVVNENFKMDKGSDKITTYPRVSGAIGPGLKAEVPGIEAAARLNSIGTSVFYTDDLKSYSAKFSLADEYLFDVLPRPVLNGNPKEILSSPMSCMVSRKIAEEIGGNVTGRLIELKEYPGKKVTIAGVFETLPENTNYKYDIIISMVSTGQFTWDGRENWLGNDRYFTCVKLSPGVKPESLAPAVRKMQEKNQDISKLEKEKGLVLKYSFNSLQKMHAADVKDMIIILGAIAFTVLFVSVLNYILLTLSTLINRAKTSVIHKTCGARSADLYRLIFSETSLIFLISLAGSMLLILALKPVAEAQLGHNLSSMVNRYVLLPVILMMILLVFLISYLTGRFYARIPIASAFSEFHQKRNNWKRVLLSLQFAGSAFILSVLVVVTLQYKKMWNADHGYSSKGVYFGSTSGMDARKISTVLNELRSMTEVEKVALGSQLPVEGASGNNVRSQDGTKELFNLADFYSIDENYLTLMDIPVLRGQNFSPESSSVNDILISRKGAEMLLLNNKWNDGVTGKQIDVTEHGAGIIRGVYNDFIINSISDPDPRPSIFFYMPEAKFEQLQIEKPSASFNILVKVHEGRQKEISRKIEGVFNLALPYKDAVIKSLEEEQLKKYQPELGFRNAMMAGNFIILLITALGLLGYTSDEAIRRSKELAIRRINGAGMNDILQMFNKDLVYVAIPSILVGIIAAWFTAEKWMTNFAYKMPLHWGIFTICSLFVLTLVIFLASVNYIRMANQNPVESLRYE
jgi:putative ABC transport system permease protein